MKDEIGLHLTSQTEDKFLNTLHFLIKAALRVLAVLMVLVVLWGVADVCWILFLRVKKEPIGLLNINDMFTTFGAFLTVLIAIEIFVNIVLYLKDNVIHVRLVIATALMAIARKVIIFDFDHIDYKFVISTTAVVFALGITYWLISEKSRYVSFGPTSTKKE